MYFENDTLKGPCHRDRQVLLKADLWADEDSGLDPLVLLAPPILEPDSDDARVEARHLHKLLLFRRQQRSVQQNIMGPKNKKMMSSI